jgi:hypothetical protein
VLNADHNANLSICVRNAVRGEESNGKKQRYFISALWKTKVDRRGDTGERESGRVHKQQDCAWVQQRSLYGSTILTSLLFGSIVYLGSTFLAFLDCCLRVEANFPAYILLITYILFSFTPSLITSSTRQQFPLPYHKTFDYSYSTIPDKCIH